MSLLNYSVPFAAASSPPPYYQPPHNYNQPQGYQPPNSYQNYQGGQNAYSGYSSYQPRQQRPTQNQPSNIQPPNVQPAGQPNLQPALQPPVEPNLGAFPGKPPGFTRVDTRTSGGAGAKTQIHAVVDYDDDFEDYQDDDSNLPHVTPIQGPIFLKNGSVPVVPLYSYPQFNNGSFIQIPVSLLFFLII